MADARDLDVVADDVVMAAYWNGGEKTALADRDCLCISRSKTSCWTNSFNLTTDWLVGDPLDPETKIGPMIEKSHQDKVLGYLEIGRGEGATVLVGGQALLQETGGFFVAPTILDDVRMEMRASREEIFGPVISTIAFESEGEAIALANDTNYGLAASLWTTNIDVALRVSRAIKAGTVSVNCYSEGDISTPFGGYKESGFGGRDNGLEAFDQYTERKTIWIATRPAVHESAAAPTPDARLGVRMTRSDVPYDNEDCSVYTCAAGKVTSRSVV